MGELRPAKPGGSKSDRLNRAQLHPNAYQIVSPFRDGQDRPARAGHSMARELAPRNIHPAHFVADGAIDMAGEATTASIPSPSPTPISMSIASRAAPGPGGSSSLLLGGF